MSRTVELHFTYTEREYTAAVRKYYQTFQTRVAVAFSFIIFVLGLGLWLLDGDAYASTILMLGGLLFSCHYILDFHLLPRRLYRSNPQFREAYHLQFSDDGLVFKSKDINSSFKWGFYSRVVETPDFYYLLYGKDNYTLVPKRAFASPTQESIFRAIISQHLGGKSSLGDSRNEGQLTSAAYAPRSLEPPDWR